MGDDASKFGLTALKATIGLVRGIPRVYLLASAAGYYEVKVPHSFDHKAAGLAYPPNSILVTHQMLNEILKDVHTKPDPFGEGRICGLTVFKMLDAEVAACLGLLKVALGVEAIKE